jgi:Amt family ammonium transporter
VRCTMASTNATILELIGAIDYTTAGALDARSADTLWLMICAFLVFFMQCGFALLEAGTVRAKNTKNILLKNLLDACVGCLIWYGFGHAIAYGAGNGFIGMTEVSGTEPWFFLNTKAGQKGDNAEHAQGFDLASWFFQYVFAAAAATIVSGAMAERTALAGYIVYTTIITGFIYPVVVHWVWSGDGFLSAFAGDYWASKDEKYPVLGGVMDFAGSGVVHMTGGVAALCGAAIVGPRTGRFDESKNALPMPGHSTTLQVMGTFILWLGWYGFNPGSTLGIAPQGYAQLAARAVVCTTISASAGGLTVILLEKLVGDKTWSVGAACNGILGGLVSITAGCTAMYPGFALLTGFLGGLVYFGASKCVLTVCKVDDPLDAFAVHGACGFWGVFAVGLFAADEFDYRVSTLAEAPGGALTHGKGYALGAACVQLACIIGWVASLSCIMFMLLKVVGILRVSAEMEAAGMDVSKHGGAAYES